MFWLATTRATSISSNSRQQLETWLTFDLTKQLALYREYVVADMEVTKHIPETPTHTKSGGYRDSEHRRAHSVAWTRKHAAMAALPEDKTDG
jgi:hypothetical protein